MPDNLATRSRRFRANMSEAAREADNTRRRELRAAHRARQATGVDSEWRGHTLPMMRSRPTDRKDDGIIDPVVVDRIRHHIPVPASARERYAAVLDLVAIDKASDVDAARVAGVDTRTVTRLRERYAYPANVDGWQRPNATEDDVAVAEAIAQRITADLAAAMDVTGLAVTGIAA